MPLLYMSSCLLPEDMKSWIAKFFIVLLLPSVQRWLCSPSLWGDIVKMSDVLFFTSSEMGYFPGSNKYMCVDETICPFHSAKMHTCTNCHNSWLDPRVCYFKPSHLVMYCSPSRMYSADTVSAKRKAVSWAIALLQNQACVAQAVLSVKMTRLEESWLIFIS